MSESNGDGCVWGILLAVGLCVWGGIAVKDWYRARVIAQVQSAQPGSQFTDAELRASRSFTEMPEDYLPNNPTYFPTDLLTSWASSQTGGVVRYQIEIRPPQSLAGASALTDLYLRSIRKCDFGLELKDSGGFVILKHPVEFTGVTGVNQQLEQLVSDDMTPMTRADYVAVYQGGTWGLEYACAR